MLSSQNSQKEDEKIVGTLFEARADVNFKGSKNGTTYLQIAKRKGHEAVVELLESYSSVE
jgi:ankyrin repeat protein